MAKSTPAKKRTRSRASKRGGRSTRSAPPLLAAIDVGATAVRMQIAQVNADESLTIIENLVHPIAVGADTFQRGRISPATGRALREVLQNFSHVLGDYGLSLADCRAVGTSAVRESTNRMLLLDRIRHDTGIELEVLDASEETRLAYQILLPFLRNNGLADRANCLVLDLGGGSTEIMVLQGARVLLTAARRLGTARLFHSIDAAEVQNTEALMGSLVQNVVSSAEDLYRHMSIRECLVINGTIAEALAHQPKAEAVEGGLCAPIETVEEVARLCSDLPAEALARRLGVGPAEVELLVPGMHALEAFLDTLTVTRVFFPEVELIRGLFMDELMRRKGEDPYEVFREQILNAAMSLSEKYHAEGGHSLQVTRLCRLLFDELGGYLDMDERDRLFLEVAGILHDVGRYINDNDHHKHGAYIVHHSDIMGLSDEERDLVALLVRYHRKGRPRKEHPEFAQLTDADQLRMSKLAAILRVADALDRGHEERIRDLRVEIGEEDLDIYAAASGDLAVERDALLRKATLLVDLTGLRVNLHKWMV
jgi:exopolyphosphatase/guanosine-5'-triphosphate,3'-diphosphate pyrophosphatase